MSSIPDHLTAALADRYTVERELGIGGMATVYLAHDLKHDRKVALKVLRPELAAVVGADRFLAEIRTTANLQHPHILPLFDSGEADGFLYFVMPYVEGESLRDRLDREGELPVEEAVRIATAVGSALDYAHRRGVIHRDIKPANILLHDGQPLVADFGIALAVSAAGGGRLTETGLSLGTPYYMSPEQATAERDPDPRSDVYALGCVLYEMLVGEPPYTAPSAQAVLGKLLTMDPVPPTQHRRAIPVHVEAAVLEALEKRPADRFGTSADFVAALADPGFRRGSAEPVPSSDGAGAVRRAAIAIAALAGIVIGWLAGSLNRTPDSSRDRVVRFIIRLEAEQEISPEQGVNLTLAPDGSWLAFRGASQLWRRSLDSLGIEPIPGTAEARNPAISPDGRSIAFAALGSLKVVSLEGGPPRTVVEEGVPGGNGGIDWANDETLYFTDDEGSIHRVSISGEPERLTTNEPGTHHAWLDVLPGGRGLLFTLTRGTLPELSEIMVLSLADGAVRPLLRGTLARYANSGHIVFAVADGTLMAAPFDLNRMDVVGPSFGLGEKVVVYNGSATQFTLSADGTLLYELPRDPAESIPVWVTRDGTAQEIDPAFRVRGFGWSPLSLSANGTRLAVANEEEPDRVTLWIKELDRGPINRIAAEGSVNMAPRWSPDGGSLLFVSNRAGQEDLWRQAADGSGQAELVLDRPREIYEAAYSPDGEWLVYRENAPSIGDIMAMRLAQQTDPIPLAAGASYGEHSLALSPNGRWLAYVSDHSGENDVYLKRFPDPASPVWPVSLGGGSVPLWSRDGRELFFRDGAEQLVAARVEGDSTPVIGPRSVLFSTAGYALGGEGAGRRAAAAWENQTYDVAPDGRFVMLNRTDQRQENQLVVVRDFVQLLRERPAR